MRVDGSQPFKVEAKMMRVSKGPDGSNETSGSWRIQNLNEDPVGITSTWKGGGGRLAISYGDGYGWEAKLDGKEYPVKGTYVNETVSLKPLGDHSVEATYRRDGKIVSVEKITVSSDGTKMTRVSEDKLTGRVSTLIAEKQ
jgi:hypothetical protein